MLLVVSPNLAVDRILEVDGFRPGEVQRTVNVISQPGGKGSNFARVFEQLGGEVVLVGFVGRRNADWITSELEAKGVHVEAIVAYDGETRHCTTICDTSSTQHPTVINEESPQIDPSALHSIERTVDQYIAKAQVLLVTGSLPRGLAVEFYRRMIERVRGKQLLTAIDATGDVMKEALRARPTLAKANLSEMESALDSLGSDPAQIAAALQHRLELPSQTIVTLGEAGAILSMDGQSWHCAPPMISRVNPIGAGDAFLAGFLKAQMDGDSPVDALKFATAVAASDAATIEPGWITPREITSLVSQTNVSALSLGNGQHDMGRPRS